MQRQKVGQGGNDQTRKEKRVRALAPSPTVGPKTDHPRGRAEKGGRENMSVKNVLEGEKKIPN